MYKKESDKMKMLGYLVGSRVRKGVCDIRLRDKDDVFKCE